MGARHYSTTLGRFLQREPMTLVGLPNPANPLGVNAYLYSHNSPTTTSDISGLQQVGASSTSKTGILYPPEKPEVQPYEPLPDPDPGFEMPLPEMPGMMGLQCPWIVRPWWDRRGPSMPLPPMPGFKGFGPETMIATPTGPATLPDTPPAPGTPIINPPKNPWDGVLMSTSSGGGDMPFIPGVNPITPADAAKMREQTAKVREQFAKNKTDWAGKKSEMVGLHLGHEGSEYDKEPTNVVGEQTKSDFNKAWKDQGLGWKYAMPGLVVAAAAAAPLIASGISILAVLACTATEDIAVGIMISIGLYLPYTGLINIGGVQILSGQMKRTPGFTLINVSRGGQRVFAWDVHPWMGYDVRTPWYLWGHLHIGEHKHIPWQ